MSDDPIRAMREAAARAACAAEGHDPDFRAMPYAAPRWKGYDEVADAALIAGLRALGRFTEFGFGRLSRSPHILASDIEAQSKEPPR